MPMRIIAGKWRGMKLNGGKFEDLRPLTDRIKESVFGILGAAVENSRVLDLYAGSGSIGIEALSRGAQRVVFVERSLLVAKLIRDNLTRTKCDPGKYEVVVLDVQKTLPLFSRRQLRFEIIFADPPFRTPIGEQLLASLSHFNLLVRKGILVYRHHKKETVPDKIAGLVLERSKIYGDSVVEFYEEAEGNANSNLSGNV